MCFVFNYVLFTILDLHRLIFETKLSIQVLYVVYIVQHPIFFATNKLHFFSIFFFFLHLHSKHTGGLQVLNTNSIQLQDIEIEHPKMDCLKNKQKQAILILFFSFFFCFVSYIKLKSKDSIVNSLIPVVETFELFQTTFFKGMKGRKNSTAVCHV